MARAHSKITQFIGIQKNIHPGCHHSNRTKMIQDALLPTVECFRKLLNIYKHTHTHDDDDDDDDTNIFSQK